MAAISDPSDATANAVALLWTVQSAPRRGPKPTLTLETIARAGIEVADADGLAAVTMQRVAEALGVTKMALYRYVPGKVELVALMTDIGLGEPPRLDTVDGGWRPRLHEWARQLCDRFSGHPWAIESTVGARAFGPNELGWMEQAVAALADTGLEGAEMLDVAATLSGHVRTIAAQHSAEPGGAPEQTMGSVIAAILHDRADQFPALSAAMDSAAHHGSQDNALDFGLSRILDGVELFIRNRGSRWIT